jgi:hypothetical protein
MTKERLESESSHHSRNRLRASLKKKEAMYMRVRVYEKKT